MEPVTEEPGTEELRAIELTTPELTTPDDCAPDCDAHKLVRADRYCESTSGHDVCMQPAIWVTKFPLSIVQ